MTLRHLAIRMSSAKGKRKGSVRGGPGVIAHGHLDSLRAGFPRADWRIRTDSKSFSKSQLAMEMSSADF